LFISVLSFFISDGTSIKEYIKGFQSGPVPGTFTRLRSCIVPAEITEPPKISGGENHKYDKGMYIPNMIVKSLHAVFLQRTLRDGAQGNVAF
jgi:hypothetical protein